MLANVTMIDVISCLSNQSCGLSVSALRSYRYWYTKVSDNKLKVLPSLSQLTNLQTLYVRKQLSVCCILC